MQDDVRNFQETFFLYYRNQGRAPRRHYLLYSCRWFSDVQVFTCSNTRLWLLIHCLKLLCSLATGHKRSLGTLKDKCLLVWILYFFCFFWLLRNSLVLMLIQPYPTLYWRCFPDLLSLPGYWKLVLSVFLKAPQAALIFIKCWYRWRLKPQCWEYLYCKKKIALTTEFLHREGELKEVEKNAWGRIRTWMPGNQRILRSEDWPSGSSSRCVK